MIHCCEQRACLAVCEQCALPRGTSSVCFLFYLDLQIYEFGQFTDKTPQEEKSQSATTESKAPSLKAEIAKLLEEYEPVKAYVGNPKLLNGSDGSAVAKVLEFTEFLTANFDLPMTLVDERLSTVTAAKKLRESGIDAKGAKSLIDAAAAVAILEQGMANEVR